MNTYAKLCPNVFVAKCPDAHQKGDVIILTSKYGKETEVEIHNLVKTSEDAYFYSFTRCDGVSEQYCEAANEGREFLRLGEPIKIGHHSEKRHRALIERNARRMDKSIEEMRKAESYDGKIAYWEQMAGKIDLSMPESLEFFKFELEKAKEKHQELKDKPELRTHALSLTYAKKAVNELEKKVKLAELLWA